MPEEKAAGLRGNRRGSPSPPEPASQAENVAASEPDLLPRGTARGHTCLPAGPFCSCRSGPRRSLPRRELLPGPMTPERPEGRGRDSEPVRGLLGGLPHGVAAGGCVMPGLRGTLLPMARGLSRASTSGPAGRLRPEPASVQPSLETRLLGGKGCAKQVLERRPTADKNGLFSGNSPLIGVPALTAPNRTGQLLRCHQQTLHPLGQQPLPRQRPLCSGARYGQVSPSLLNGRYSLRLSGLSSCQPVRFAHVGAAVFLEGATTCQRGATSALGT